MRETKLKVNEIFYSIQGEGANTGMPAIFIRLSGCNLRCPFCDTKHEKFTEMYVDEVLQEVKKYDCLNIVWTGGEPTLQLTDEILSEFQNYYNCIETNGTKPLPELIDYIACSPKVPIGILNKNFHYVDEFRYPVKVGDELPDIDILPNAEHYYISPIDVSPENIEYCTNLIKTNLQWKLSIQIHKLLNLK